MTFFRCLDRKGDDVSINLAQVVSVDWSTKYITFNMTRGEYIRLSNTEDIATNVEGALVAIGEVNAWVKTAE